MESTGETVEEITRQIENCDVLNELYDSTDVIESNPLVDKSGEVVPESVKESVTELISGTIDDPTSESDSEPTTQPITELFTEPITETITEPITETITEPITEPTTQPTTQPITELITQPIAQPTTESAPNPIVEEASTSEQIPKTTHEPTPRSLSHLKLSDLISDTVSLTRSPSQIPDELNTRLFMLNQQINSETPDTRLIRELLSYHAVPSIPEDYRHGVYCSLLGVFIYEGIDCRSHTRRWRWLNQWTGR